jgi:hypothetical protein
LAADGCHCDDHVSLSLGWDEQLWSPATGDPSNSAFLRVRPFIDVLLIEERRIG